MYVFVMFVYVYVMYVFVMYVFMMYVFVVHVHVTAVAGVPTFVIKRAYEYKVLCAYGTMHLCLRRMRKHRRNF